MPQVSREAVLRVDDTHVTVLGGLRAGGVSSGEVDLLDLASGTTRRVGTLALPVHDAATGLVGTQEMVVGGGAPTTLGQVQTVTVSATAVTGRPRVTGRLPRPRSDATGVTVGGRLFIVGGYDGSVADPMVLATTNGRTFTDVADLPVPVRYPAVVTLGGVIYVLGGQATQGPDAGRAVDVVQMIDPARRSARVMAHLPHPLTGANAVPVAGVIYLLCGRETAETTATATHSIDRLDPHTGHLVSVGNLPVPVSNAPAVVTGRTVWLVGGETVSTPQPYVQRVVITP
ncbi:hypothetical protein [Leekyejoonella antrihumi]|uniref:hypothetical protein n=1 Tax=Leekyejoonella antrihumi TaxID=1660198 RepID=UPI0016452D6D|nr:hypothetical protein [Leekyejoonella antrihumi]